MAATPTAWRFRTSDRNSVFLLLGLPVKKFERHRPMGRCAARAKRRGDQRRFRDLFATRTRSVRRLGMNLQAIRTLSGSCDGDGDELTVFSRNRPVLTPDDAIQTDPCVKILRREFPHLAHQPQIVFIMIMF